MKKFIFPLAISALALVGCTSEEVVNEGLQSNAITFTQVLNKDSRSLSSMDDFNSFYVYAYYTKGADLNTRFNIFNDTQVNKDGEGNWSSKLQRYWVPDANYSFYAYSCDNLQIAPDFGGPSLGKEDGVFRLNYTVHNVGGVSHDLVMASATGIKGKETGNLPVPFQFKHILSKINLRFINEFPEGYKIEITNVKISQFMNTGSFTASNNSSDNVIGSWSNAKYDGGTTNTFALNTIETNTLSKPQDEVITSECYLIPHHYTESDNPVKIQFQIKVSNTQLTTDQTILSNTLSGSWHPNWRLGTQYTYTVKLSGNEAGMEPISFNVSVDDWNNPGQDNQPEDINISIDVQSQPVSE